MWYNYVIFIAGCGTIAYLCYRQVSSMVYNTLLTRKMRGEQVPGFPKLDEFEDNIKEMTREIIENYEAMKEKKTRKKKDNKDDRMFQ